MRLQLVLFDSDEAVSCFPRKERSFSFQFQEFDNFQLYHVVFEYLREKVLTRAHVVILGDVTNSTSIKVSLQGTEKGGRRYP